ncbi:hypothetical protein PJE062_1421 [Pseudovibrio sp. JE062]|nr:hypothetical protein PJE062_1421 [Pseudovibrio sp. JE062]
MAAAGNMSRLAPASAEISRLCFLKVVRRPEPGIFSPKGAVLD